MLIYAAYLPVWALTVSPISTVLIYHFHMYGGFADAEFLGGGTNGRPVLYQVLGKLAGSLFQIVSNMAPLPCCCGLSIWGRAGEYDRESCGAQSVCGQRWLPSFNKERWGRSLPRLRRGERIATPVTAVTGSQ